MIISTLTPTNYFVPWEFVTSLLSVYREYPFFKVQSPYLGGNRNKILQHAKEKKDDFLMIDSDIIFTKEQVKKMEKNLQKYDIVTGVYAMGAAPHQPTIFKSNGDLYDFIPIQEGVFEIDGCGGGFLAISKRVLDLLPDDAFTPLTKTDGGEDVSFCKVAKSLGLKIMCDGDIRVGHLRTKAIYP